MVDAFLSFSGDVSRHEDLWAATSHRSTSGIRFPYFVSAGLGKGSRDFLTTIQLFLR